MKKFLALILVLAMVLSVSSFAMAAGELPDAVGGFITLTDGSNYELTENVELGTNRIKVPNGATVTLDLNEYTISGNGSEIIYVANGGTLIINSDDNGAITNNVGNAIGNYGTVTVNGGTFTGIYALYNYFYEYDDGTIIYGKATITGGTFKSGGHDSEGNDMSIANCGELTIKGGNIEDTLDSTAKLTIEDGTVENLELDTPDYNPPETITSITGGTFTGTVESRNDGSGTAAQSGFITGGTFSAEPKAEWFAEGKEAVMSDGKWVVQAEKVVAQIGDKTYTTLDAANSVAKSGDTVIISSGTYDITKDDSGEIFEFKAGVTYEGATKADGTPDVIFKTNFKANCCYVISDGAKIKNIQFDIESVCDGGHIFAGYKDFSMDNCIVNIKNTVDKNAYVFDLNTNESNVAITNSTFNDETPSEILTWVVACNYESGYNGATLAFTGNTITGNWSNGIIELLAGNYTVKDNKVDVNGKPNTLFSIAVVPDIDENDEYTHTISGNEGTAAGAGAFVRYMPIDNSNTDSGNPTKLTLADNIVADISDNSVSGVGSTFDIVLSRQHSCFATLEYAKSPFGTSAYTTSNQTAEEFVKVEEFKAIHTHDWSGAWGSNDTHHWKECANADCDVTIDNTQKGSYAAHVYTDGKCECGKEEPEGTETKKIEVKDGITVVPDELKNIENLDTTEEIVVEMEVAIEKKSSDVEGVVVYDVTFMVSKDDGNTWVKADEEHWPEDGKLTVTLPYPNDEIKKNRDDYDFIVAHMLTSGEKAGTIEYPEPITKTDEGIQFVVTSLSPISVGWKKVAANDVPASKPSSGTGIKVQYMGGNSFSTTNSDTPIAVEIDGVPVSFTGNGKYFTVGCIQPGADWVTVKWHGTTVTTNFTPDVTVVCTQVGLPKTGDVSVMAYALMAVIAAAGAMLKK